MRRPAHPPAGVNTLGLLTAAVLVGLWEGLVRLRVLDYQYLPAPSEIARGLGMLAVSGDLLPDVLHTLKVTLLGWAAASALGITLGVALGLSNRAWRYSMASMEVARAVPPITLVPLALLLFGFSLRMELVIVVFASVWPVLVNTIGGVRRVPAELLDVARMLRFTRVETTTKMVVPAAMPLIVVGLRLALSLALVLAIVAEMIGNPTGLGNGVVRSQQALQPDAMFAYVVTIGFLGVMLNTAFRHAVSVTLPAAVGQEDAR